MEMGRSLRCKFQPDKQTMERQRDPVHDKNCCKEQTKSGGSFMGSEKEAFWLLVVERNVVQILSWVDCPSFAYTNEVWRKVGRIFKKVVKFSTWLLLLSWIEKLKIFVGFPFIQLSKRFLNIQKELRKQHKAKVARPHPQHERWSWTNVWR